MHPQDEQVLKVLCGVGGLIILAWLHVKSEGVTTLIALALAFVAVVAFVASWAWHAAAH